MTTTTQHPRTLGARKAGFAAAAAAALTLFGIVPAAHADDSDVIDIPDEALRECILDHLSLDDEGDLTADVAAGLTSLTCRNQSIETLSGLEHFTTLGSLILTHNGIADVEPLQGLQSLTSLSLDFNNLSTIAPLSGLSLEELTLHGNNVSELEPLRGMNSLKRLLARGNGITSLAPISGLTGLESLLVEENDIRDLSPLEHLVSLKELWLGGNGLNDDHIKSMSGFSHPDLAHLRLSNNGISDLSPLQGLTSLTQLWLTDNNIADLSPLEGLQSLNHVRLDNNRITDVSDLPTPIGTLNVSGQSVDLGALTVGVAQPNPVFGFDGNAVPLAGELYDEGGNEFTPTADGPTDMTWEDQTGDFTGTLNFSVDTLDAPLQVDVQAELSYDARYEWDVTLAGQDVVVPAGTGTVEVDYEAVATPSGPEAENLRISFDVTVTNPNPFTVEDVTVGGEADSDALFICNTTQEVAIPAEGANVVSLTCDLPEGTATDAAFTVNASATWGDEPASNSASDTTTVDFSDVDPTPVYNQYRDLMIEGHELDDAPVWFHAEDGEQSHDFAIEWPAPEAGQCADVTLHGGLGDDNIMLERAEDATVTICTEAPLQVTKNPTATFDRHYEWGIDKSVTTDGTVDERGEATFDYLVEVQPTGFTDSGWAMAGEIEVHNPNTFGQIAFDVAEVTDLGAQCTVEEDSAIPVAGGDTITLGYECLFEEAPDYTTTSTATVTWTDPAGDEASASGSAAALFEVDGETDRAVQVWDDHTDPANPVLLGEADWTDSETWVFDYSLVLPGVVGETVTFTNTAWIEATGENPQASTTVEIGIGVDSDPEPGAEAEAAAASGLPATGAPIAAGAGLLALLLAASGLAFLAVRRRAQV